MLEAASLEELARVAAGCRRCRLRAGCRQVVFGEGNPRARLMFVGEGPGEQEDLEGRPFVGRAGQLLDRMIEAMGLRRGDVYIANVVKCRPPGNRQPLPDEADACWPFLSRQIELVDPAIIVCLGATAARRLVDPRAGVLRSRGQWFQRNGRRVAVTFHPAALLRNPSQKKLAWEDLQMVMAEYSRLTGTKGR
ncbi:MAG: uracil-DNA glycosylase [Firmicutes bacterium]|nr:uracil-DNA glycosylase [Bacillota bacterium]